MLLCRSKARFCGICCFVVWLVVWPSWSLWIEPSEYGEAEDELKPTSDLWKDYRMVCWGAGKSWGRITVNSRLILTRRNLTLANNESLVIQLPLTAYQYTRNFFTFSYRPRFWDYGQTCKEKVCTPRERTCVRTCAFGLGNVWYFSFFSHYFNIFSMGLGVLAKIMTSLSE